MKQRLQFSCLFLGLLLFLYACGKQESIPEFPWPPPQASASMILPPTLLVNTILETTHIRAVDSILSNTLEECGYMEKSYYAVPDGFALVTRLEQIYPDGTPKEEPERWNIEVSPLRSFSLKEYLRALFTANPGYFRVVVFIITPHPFTQTEAIVSRDEAMDWLRAGANRLPDSITRRKYSKEYTITALIYEFEKPEFQEPALKIPGLLTGKDHLEKSGFLDALVQ